MISTVYVAKNVYGGDGLGRLGDGRVVFVPGAWQGEQVRAEIVSEKRGFVKARLVEIVEASPDRIDGGGGSIVPGCVYANISPQGEMKAKESQLREFFERARIGVDRWSVFPLPENSFFNYRNKVVYHFDMSGGKVRIGYRSEPSHEIVDIQSDPLAAVAINDKLPEIRRSVAALVSSGPVAVRRDVLSKGKVTVRWSAKSGVRWWVGDAPKDLYFKETTCSLDFEVPAGGFYQVNPEVGSSLVQAVVDEYRKGAGDAPDVLDLYCGVGVFGLCARPSSLTGIESGREAIASARRNAQAQHFDSARFFSCEVGKNTGRIRIGDATSVIVDPPRGGLEKGVAKWLERSGARRIFYVSCDGATLIRDLREICGSYRVSSVALFNMFPRTARFETLAVLERNTAGKH